MKVKSLVLGTAIMVLGTPVWSENTTLDKTKISGSADAGAQIEDIVILDAAALASQLVLNIDDTVRYIPGVNITDTGRFGDNGFNIRGMDSDRVAITVDGLSQGESLDPPSYSAYEFFRSTRNSVEIESVKVVRIVKGANSVEAGSGALGGAVMYTTKEAADYLEPGADDTNIAFKSGYDGRYDEFMLSGSFTNRIGRLESLVNYTHRKGHERINGGGGDSSITGPGATKPDPFDYKKTNVLVSLGFQINDAHRIGAVFEKYKNASEIDNRSRSDGTYLRRWSNDESARLRYGLSYEWNAELAMFDTAELKVNRQEIDSSGVTLIDYCSAFAGCDGSNPYLRMEDRAFDQTATFVTLDFDKQVDLGALSHSMVYGVGYEQRDGQTALMDIRFNTLSPDSGFRDTYPRVDADFIPKTKVDAFSLYVRDQVQLTEQFELTAGLRFDDYQYTPKVDEQFSDPADVVKDSSFSGLSWQLGAAFEFIPGNYLIADIGSGFKAPTFQQLYLDTRGNTIDDWDTIPNTKLDSETALNYELGYEWRGDRGRARLSVFRNDYKDFIEYATYTRNVEIDGAPIVDEYEQPVNSGKIRVTGIELEAQYAITESIGMQFSFSHNKGEYRNEPANDSFGNTSRVKGDPLESINPDVAVLGLSYDAPDERWGLQSKLVLTAKKKQSDAVFTDADGVEQPLSEFLSDASTVLDLFAYFQPMQSLRITAAVTNVTDQKHFAWQRLRFVGGEGSAIRGAIQGDGINRYTEPGRAFSLTAAFQF